MQQARTAAPTDLRSAMLDAAEQQLITSDDNDIAIRSVCDAVGVTQPVLYRLFGDKQGLLDALADRGMERYAAHKSEQQATDDPVADLRAGWDDHMRFARDNPALYQLMFGPAASADARAVRAVFDLLVEVLTRCAAVGALRTEPQIAARSILSANVGSALNRIAEPALFDDDDRLSHRLRAAIFCEFLPGEVETAAEAPIGEAALRLRSQLQTRQSDVLETAELRLLDRWLVRLVQSGD